MVKAVLGLGGNQGEPLENLREALAALNRVPGIKVTSVSSVYKTAPVGFADQPDFYNLVAEVETDLSPRALLGACLGIEATLGRVRTFRNAPRLIDIDVLLAEGTKMNEAELTLPHPRMMERGFVLIPLRELYPYGVALGVNFAEQALAVENQRVDWYGALNDS